MTLFKIDFDTPRAIQTSMSMSTHRPLISTR